MTKIMRKKENARMGIERNELRKNKRVFSYSLAVLFSCVLGEAQSAKLCRRNANTYAYNNSAGIWAVGTGCGEFYYGGGDGAKTGTDPATYCTSRFASGEVKYAKIGIYDGLVSSSPNFNNAADAGSGVDGARCFCRVVWPQLGKWIMHPETGIISDCPRRCGRTFGGTEATAIYLW